jgi:hypothetical protein
MMGSPSTAAFLAALLQFSALGGSDGSGTGVGGSSGGYSEAVHDGAAGNLEVMAPTPSDLDMKIDGVMDEAAWSDAPLLTGFTQYDPVEGIPASQSTEVRVLVTDGAILFGIRAHDNHAGGIRATLARRDGFGRSDDWVRVILDTFNDRRRAFVFQVNPLGVQGDGLWVEGRGGRGEPIDWNPDFLWSSAGRMDGGGYTVEIEVPFKSLRFPDLPLQDWGLQVTRNIQRSGFSAAWAPVTSDVASRLAQSGSLRGLANLDPGLFMEVNPVLTASRQGSWSETAGGLVREPAAGDFGLNVTYGLTSNLTLDGTYNPDFSQVEADAGQITVNERFALYLPEKRPFFLEGTDVFALPQRLVYTRSISNPVGAAKLSGKFGGTTVAYIGAVDEMSTGVDPVVNLLRLRRDIGRSSSVGAIYTDRTAPGQSSNRVAGADARLVLAGRYTLSLMGAFSADGATGEATRWGSTLSADFSRAGRNLSLGASFRDVTPDFRARSGFIRRVGITEASARTGYTWRGGRGSFVERVGASVQAEGVWSHDQFWAGGGPEEWEVDVTLSGSLRGNIGGFLSYSRDSYRLGADRYDGLYSQDGERLIPFNPSPTLFSGLHSFRIRSWVSTWERVRGSFGASWSETPVFDRTGVPADLANSFSADVGLSLYPTSALSMELGARHVRLTRQRDGSHYSSATIPRIQGRLQFSRSLFVRATGEYASQGRGDVLDPVAGRPIVRCSAGACAGRSASEAHNLSVETLVGYEPSPGTVIFVGYSRAMRDASPFGFENVQAQSDGLFVKLSYRFRM